MAINNGLNNPVFSTPDSTDSPLTLRGWTAQGVQIYVKNVAPVFVTLDKTRTPATVPGWTVQSVATGSDQHLL
jgi:hypothetical protein